MYKSWCFFTWEWNGNMCLSVWLEFFVPLVIHMERSPLSVKDCKFWPLFGTFKPTNYNRLVLTREYQLQKSRKKSKKKEQFDIKLMVHFMSWDVNIPWMPWDVTNYVGHSKKAYIAQFRWYLTGFHDILIFNYHHSPVSRRGGEVS